MLRQITAFSILLLAAIVARPDEPRYRYDFVSANGKFEAKMTDGQWQIFERGSGRLPYTFSDKLTDRIRFSSMSLLVSNDGTNVVAVDDFSEQKTPVPEVVFFISNGERLKTYKLNELIDPRFVSYSVSHFHWCHMGPQIALTEDRLRIVTNDLRKLSFDIRTGAMVNTEEDARLSDGALFVSGKVHQLYKQNYEITVSCTVRGDVKPGSKVSFIKDKSTYVTDGFYSALIIKDGKLVANMSSVFNNCDQ